jgi:hypothetical protein
MKTVRTSYGSEQSEEQKTSDLFMFSFLFPDARGVKAGM